MYDDLIKYLRDDSNCNVLDYVDEAADAIERLEIELKSMRCAANSLKLELELVKRERDAALDALKKSKIACEYCFHADNYKDCNMECDRCVDGCECYNCRDNDRWKWIGLKED